MKLGIMQPYFFPYLGYFGLIKHTDKFIAFDPVQYIRHGWINRNRTLKQEKGWLYIKVPLKKHSNRALIKDLEISTNVDLESRILNQLEHYKKIAPYYHQVIEFLKDCFKNEYRKITELDVHLLKKTCEYINIDFNSEIFSNMNLKIGNINAPGQWALEISKAMSAREYINPPGGKEIFNLNKFKEAGIRLRFLEVNLKEYDQKRKSFEPGLSIIGVMMFNSPKEINEMLDDYQLTEK